MASEKYSPALPLFVGCVALLMLVLGVGVWSVRTEIAGAIIASGMIEVEHNRQAVQHAEGGIVGEILARDGDRVLAGDPLIQLDDTLLKSELAVAELQLIELAARQARLVAERDGKEALLLPPSLTEAASATARDQIEGQRKLFHARRETLARELTQIDERIRQTGNRVIGTEAQIAALRTQAALVDEEFADLSALLKKGLVPAGRVLTLRREAARIAGEIGQLTARVAEYKGEIAGNQIERLRRQTERRENAISELRDIQFRELELTEKRRGLTERLARLHLTAPVSGVVYGSTVFARKAVIQPADTVMFIVPQDQPLIVGARVEAIHIDQVHVGQPATLRFPAFNQRITPEVTGRVATVSADIIRDDVTGVPYYRVDVIPLADELPKLEGQELLPGMPVEAYLRTEDRTPLSYLMKPLTDYFGRAFRES